MTARRTPSTHRLSKATAPRGPPEDMGGVDGHMEVLEAMLNLSWTTEWMAMWYGKPLRPG